MHSRIKHMQVQDDPSFDDPPRNIIYRMFDSSGDETMNYLEFSKFMKYSWLYQSFDKLRKGLINDVNFWDGVRQDISPIPLSSDEKNIVASAGDWIGGMSGMSLNLKQFFIWFRYPSIFFWLRTTGMNVHAIQSKIHKGFVQLGLRLAHATENLMHDGYE